MKRRFKNYIEKCKKSLVFKAYSRVYDFNHFGKLHIKMEKLENALRDYYKKLTGRDFWQDAIG